MISSPKAIIIIFWSPVGFPVIQALPPKVTFTSELFVDDILPHIVAPSQLEMMVDPWQVFEGINHKIEWWVGNLLNV
jgi:hypothetical protein